MIISFLEATAVADTNAQASVELQFQLQLSDANSLGNNDTNEKQSETTIDDITKNDDNEKDKDDDLLFYSKIDQFMIFLLIFCDFYIRSFSILFPLFMIRYVLHLYLKVILSLLTIIHLFLIGKFEFKLVLWMKQSDNGVNNTFNFHDEYLKRKLLRFQDAFLLYFSCLIEVVFTFPLKRIHNKNIFNRCVCICIYM